MTCNNANRIGGGQLIAAEAVAVITDSPAGAHHTYKVGFNDGTEAMRRRRLFRNCWPLAGAFSPSSFTRPTTAT